MITGDRDYWRQRDRETERQRDRETAEKQRDRWRQSVVSNCPTLEFSHLDLTSTLVHSPTQLEFQRTFQRCHSSGHLPMRVALSLTLAHSSSSLPRLSCSVYPALRLASTTATTPRSRPAMDTSLAYTPDRGTELAENVKDVLKEIEAAKPSGSNVSVLCVRAWKERRVREVRQSSMCILRPGRNSEGRHCRSTLLCVWHSRLLCKHVSAPYIAYIILLVFTARVEDCSGGLHLPRCFVSQDALLTPAPPCCDFQDQASLRYPGAVRRRTPALWRELHPGDGGEGAAGE